MSELSYLIPEPLGKLLSRLPAYPGSLLFTAGLNALLKPRLPADVCQALDGKSLRIRVSDAQVTFDFAWRQGRFHVAACERMPDLSISASAHDFLLLLQRREDPDTLFFSRRLVMEGETEIGLLVKNTLDAIELPPFIRDFPLARLFAQ